MSPSKTSIYKPISDSRFEYVTFSWDEAHPEHPNGFSLGANSKAAADPKITAALSKRLHGGIEDGHWYWSAGMNVSVQENGAINVHVEPEGHGPKKRANDYVNKKKDFSFEVGRAWLSVNEKTMHLSGHGREAIPNDSYTKILSAIDACR